MNKSTIAVAMSAALLVAACAGSDSGSGSSTAKTDPAPTIDPAPTSDRAAEPEPEPSVAETTTTIDPSEARTIEQINDYIGQAAAFDQVAADAQFPQGLTFAAGGAPGYSRYVFRENPTGVVPTLVEGPLEDTVRCQDIDLPCSYLELKELHASGAPIPDELSMTAAELATLVEQLDELNAFAEAHRDINVACAEGFVSDRIQTANMGTHLYKGEFIVNGFDPGQPEILLYALADDTMPTAPLGQCVDGVWTGAPMQLIGTSFIIPPQVIGDDHPDAFAGPLDNWHIHYNLCRGALEGRDSFLPLAECEAAGGQFSASLGWMIHAWVDPQHDNDLGVFSMWNPTVAPISDPGAIFETREVRGSDFPEGAEQSLITDFAYGDDLEVEVGQSLFFNNVDAVPHTVSAGSFEDPRLDEFDSGLLDPGTNWELSFDEPGVYSLFCTLHPEMQATVTVS